MDNTQQAEKYFSGDIFATQTTGIVIESASLNYAKCSLAVEPRHLNAMGFVMGGAIFTLADFTFAVAVNSECAPTVSLNSNINFISSAKCERLYAEATPIKNGKSICFYTVTITDETNKLIATVDTTGFIVRK